MASDHWTRDSINTILINSTRIFTFTVVDATYEFSISYTVSSSYVITCILV